MQNPLRVDQKITARFNRIHDFLLENRQTFAASGTIVESWRYYQGRRIGPFYKIAYRDKDRQRAIYLGNSKILIDQVRSLLADLQIRRNLRRQYAIIHKAYRQQKKHLNNMLKARGLYMRGPELRLRFSALIIRKPKTHNDYLEATNSRMPLVLD